MGKRESMIEKKLTILAKARKLRDRLTGLKNSLSAPVLQGSETVIAIEALILYCKSLNESIEKMKQIEEMDKKDEETRKKDPYLFDLNPDLNYKIR